MSNNYDIFISYRREGGLDKARTIFQSLKSNGYSSIFFDFETLQKGCFNEQLKDAVKNCQDFLLILSKNSMDRCSIEGDWVFQEIMLAIESKVNIIPITFDDGFNFPMDFPETIQIIKQHQFCKIRTDEFYEDSIKKLINKLVSLDDNAERNINVTISADEKAEVFINGELKGKLKGSDISLSLEDLMSNKEYTIKLVNWQNKQISIESKHTFEGRKEHYSVCFDFKTAKDEYKRQKEERDQRKEFLREKYQDYSGHSFFKNSMVMVKKNNKYGYLNEKGEEIVPCIYQEATDFDDSGYGLVRLDENHYYLIDKSGISKASSSQPIQIHFGYYTTCENGFILFYKIENHELISFCEGLKVYSTEIKGIYIVIDSNKKTLFNLITGNSKTFDGIRRFVKDMDGSPYLEESVHMFPALVEIGHRYGYINSKGEYVFPCIAEDIVFLNKTYLKILVRNKWGIIDSETNKWFFAPQYDGIVPYDGGYVIINQYELFVDTDDFYYRDSNCFVGGMQGVTNELGEQIIPCEYQYIAIPTYRHLGCRYFKVADLSLPFFENPYYIECFNYGDKVYWEKDAFIFEFFYTSKLNTKKCSDGYTRKIEEEGKKWRKLFIPEKTVETPSNSDKPEDPWSRIMNDLFGKYK